MTWAGSQEELQALIWEARRGRWNPYSGFVSWEGTLVAARGDMNGRIVARKIERKSKLIYDLMVFIRRFVVLTPEQLLISALWILHTHTVEAVEETPYLSVTSPERRCGKTRYLEIMELFVARPWLCALPSEASIYRRINKEHSTLLLDEVDTIYGRQTKDKYEGLRALLDAGSRRGVTITRAIGVTNKLETFDVFGPKILAGIGALPDTVADRSIPIRLKRRKRTEEVARFRRRQVGPEFTALRDQVVAWGAENVEQLAGVALEMPDALNDRAADACECLVAVADLCGVGAEARAALVTLFRGERQDDMESLRTKLLRDLRVVFGERRAMATEGILPALWAINESPWGSWYGRVFEARDLAAFMEHFGVSSKTVRVGGRPVKGYHVNQLADVWERYLK